MADCWPCCGNSLQWATSTIAVIDLVFSVIDVIFYLVFGIIVVSAVQNGDSNIVPGLTNAQVKGIAILVIVYSILDFIIEVVLFLVLRAGSRLKNYTKCKTWLCIRIVFFILEIILSIILIASGNYSVGRGIMDIVLLYRVYTLSVVKSFMNEILHESPNVIVEK